MKLRIWSLLIVFSALALLVACGGGGGGGDVQEVPPATYDDSSLSGAWLWIPTTAGEQDVYLVSDGNGLITEFGAIGVAGGHYTVAEDGLCSMTLLFSSGDPDVAIDCYVTSATTGTASIPNAGVDFDMYKVADIAALQGVWVGDFIEDAAPKDEYPVSITIDANGVITGFATPVTGHIFSEQGHIAGLIDTGELDADPYNKIRIEGVINGGIINGAYEVDDGNGLIGTFILTKQ